MMPKKIKICGLEYDVILVPNREMEHGTDAPATCVPDANTSPKVQWVNLWHEIFEAIDQRFNLQLSHQTISTLEAALTSVLEDNFQGLLTR